MNVLKDEGNKMQLGTVQKIKLTSADRIKLADKLFIYNNKIERIESGTWEGQSQGLININKNYCIGVVIKINKKTCDIIITDTIYNYNILFKSKLKESLKMLNNVVEDYIKNH